MALTAADGIHFVAVVACMCSAAVGTVVAAVLLVPPDMYCLLAVGDATAFVDGLVAIVAASDAGSAIIVVSLVAVVDGAVTSGVATSVLSTYVLSTPFVCPVQI